MIHERRGGNKMFLAIATTVLTAAITAALATAWNSKTNASDFIAYVNAQAIRQVVDSGWKADTRDMVLEVLCHQNPQSRRCQRRLTTVP